MHDGSEYERHQIESLLQIHPNRPRDDNALFLMPVDDHSQRVYDMAVLPALSANGFKNASAVRVFGSESPISEICQWIQSAQIIVADISTTNADLMYVLGLCHGLRRCPLLIMPEKRSCRSISLHCDVWNTIAGSRGFGNCGGNSHGRFASGCVWHSAIAALCSC